MIEYRDQWPSVRVVHRISGTVHLGYPQTRCGREFTDDRWITSRVREDVTCERCLDIDRSRE